MNTTIRRTRGTRYYDGPNGIQSRPNELAATNYSLGLIPIEYRKVRKPRASKKKGPSNKKQPVSEPNHAVTSISTTQKGKLAQANRVFAPINLNDSVVPRPVAINSMKQLSKLNKTVCTSHRIYFSPFVHSFFHCSLAERIFYNGVPIKSEEEEERAREARRQNEAVPVIGIESENEEKENDEDEIVEEIAPLSRIVSSTMIQSQENTSCLFSDISTVSSCIPTISSATMRQLAPIIEMALAEEMEHQPVQKAMVRYRPPQYQEMEHQPDQKAIVRYRPPLDIAKKISSKSDATPHDMIRTFRRSNLSNTTDEVATTSALVPYHRPCIEAQSKSMRSSEHRLVAPISDAICDGNLEVVPYEKSVERSYQCEPKTNAIRSSDNDPNSLALVPYHRATIEVPSNAIVRYTTSSSFVDQPELMFSGELSGAEMPNDDYDQYENITSPDNFSNTE